MRLDSLSDRTASFSANNLLECKQDEQKFAKSGCRNHGKFCRPRKPSSVPSFNRQSEYSALSKTWMLRTQILSTIPYQDLSIPPNG